MLERPALMATRTKTRELLPLVTEETLLNEAMECPTNRSLETRPLAEERSFAFWQKDIPEEYWSLDAARIIARIAGARAALGQRCVVLGHHYQREDIIRFADVRGDSFKLAQWAAERPEAEYIVFCGVHFMAEAADILSQPHQKVVLPNMSTGCSMADMADPDDVYAAWDELAEAAIRDIIPVTYMNSAASLKAFCGKNGGIVFTSSNTPPPTAPPPPPGGVAGAKRAPSPPPPPPPPPSRGGGAGRAPPRPFRGRSN